MTKFPVLMIKSTFNIVLSDLLIDVFLFCFLVVFVDQQDIIIVI